MGWSVGDCKRNGNPELWESQTNSQGNRQYNRILTFPHKAQIFKADFSPDGQYVVTAGRDYRALVWNADSGQLAHPSFHHSGPVTDAGFTDDGGSLITSSFDTIQRWDLTQGESRSLPLGTMGGVRTTSADPEGNMIVTAGEREPGAEQLGSAGWARVWDTVTGDPRSPELHHPARVIHAAISGSDRQLVSTVTSDGEIRLWEASSGRELWLEKPKEGMAVYTAFGRAEGGVHLLALIRSDPRSLSSVSDLRLMSWGDGSGVPTSGNNLVIVGADNNGLLHIRIFDAGGNLVTDTDETKLPRTQAAAISTLKQQLPGLLPPHVLTGAEKAQVITEVTLIVGQTLSSNSYLRIYPLGSKGEQSKGVRTFCYAAPFTAAAFSPECKHVIAYTGYGANNRGAAVVWDLLLGKQTVLKGSGKSGAAHDGPITHAAFTSDGDYLVTTGRDHKAFVWDLSDGSYQELLANQGEETGHTAAIQFATFDRAGTRVVTAGADGWAIIWERAPDQRQFHVIQKLKNGRALTRAVFSSHERYVLTADIDGTTRLFDIKDSRPLVTKSHPGQSILQIVFSEDKNRRAPVYLIGNQARKGPASSNRQGQSPNFPVANPAVGLAWPVVTEWRLKRAVPPEEDYGPLAKWTASRKLDEKTFRTELTPLTQDVIFDLWKNTSGAPTSQLRCPVMRSVSGTSGKPLYANWPGGGTPQSTTGHVPS